MTLVQLSPCVSCTGGRLGSHLSKTVTHVTCSFLDSKDEVKEPITLPELTKQLLKAKQKLAEFPDNLKVSFQKRHCGSEKDKSFCKGSLITESLSYRK